MVTETFGKWPSFTDIAESNRPGYGSFPQFDLPSLIESMKEAETWKDGELNTMVLLDTPCMQIVLTALHAGTEINSFQSGDSVTFHIIEGTMKFRTSNESLFLNKGELMTLHENIDYSLTAREESVLLLTLANGSI
jgi:quercetin dioxygenase-like cupin family protein